MSYQTGDTFTFEVAAAISQGVFVKLDGNGSAGTPRVVVCDTAGEDAIGVTLEDVSADDIADGVNTVSVALINGRVKAEVLASAAISIGQQIVCAVTTGKAVGVTGTLTINYVGLGYALSAASAADEYVTVLLQKGTYYGGTT